MFRVHGRTQSPQLPKVHIHEVTLMLLKNPSLGFSAGESRLVP
jgi:hypothetical protein